MRNAEREGKTVNVLHELYIPDSPEPTVCRQCEGSGRVHYAFEFAELHLACSACGGTGETPNACKESKDV